MEGVEDRIIKGNMKEGLITLDRERITPEWKENLMMKGVKENTIPEQKEGIAISREEGLGNEFLFEYKLF